MGRFPRGALARRCARSMRWLAICGRGSAITRGRATCIARPRASAMTTAGSFPASFAQLAALPGIRALDRGARSSRSPSEPGSRFSMATYGACWARYFGVAGKLPQRALVAQRHLGSCRKRWYGRKCRSMRVHPQAIMDLGATVCVRHKPLCSHCPAVGKVPSPGAPGRQARAAGPAGESRAAPAPACSWWLALQDDVQRTARTAGPRAACVGGLVVPCPNLRPPPRPVPSCAPSLGRRGERAATLEPGRARVHHPL